jgi:hypothetical protein
MPLDDKFKFRIRTDALLPSDPIPSNIPLPPPFYDENTPLSSFSSLSFYFLIPTLPLPPEIEPRREDEPSTQKTITIRPLSLSLLTPSPSIILSPLPLPLTNGSNEEDETGPL